MAEKRPDIAVLKRVRLSFPKLWEKEKSTPESKEKYSLNALLKEGDPFFAENKAAINAAIKHVRDKAWGDKAAKVFEAIDTKRKAFRKGETFCNDEGDVYAGYEGVFVVVAANQNEFQRLDRDKSPLPHKSSKLYGGCYVDLVVSFYAVTTKEKGGNGIFATIEVVRFHADGEPFGNAAIDADDYLDDLDDDSGSSSGGSSGSDDDDEMI